jgi:hypothetical protein
MTPTENLSSAFECLWEAKVYLLRTAEGVDARTQEQLRSITADVAAARDRVEQALIELQAPTPPAPAPRSE